MIAALKLLWANKELVVIGLLLVALGAQSYRLQGAQAQRDLLALEKAERMKSDAQRDLAALRNKERIDEEFTAARKRATAVVVRSEPAGGVTAGPQVALTGGGDGNGAICFGGEQLNAELTGFAERHAAGLTALLAAVSQRNAARLEGVARAGEELGAAYRACRAYTLNLTNNAPGAG